jgi:ABC-type dipeptide/oligopeptide/nickel transport system permease component
MAIVMMDAILVMSGSLLADILYAVVDPRIRYS